MTQNILTQARLKQLLHYSPGRGDFTYRSSRGRAIAGGIASNTGKNGYIRIFIDRKCYLAHRLVFLYMEGVMPPQEVDHISHNKSDNRWANLRHATRSDNAKNKSLNRNNTSGVCGVYWNKVNKQWFAGMRADRKRLCGGYFDDWFDAVCARKSLENKHGFHSNHGLKR